MPDEQDPTESGPAPVYAPEEVKPPVPEANSFGGGIDAAELPPTPDDDQAGPGSAHEDAGWRAINPTR